MFLRNLILISPLLLGGCTTFTDTEISVSPGASCEEYCDTVVRSCEGEYSSEAECVRYCENAGWPRGEAGDESSANTVQCRFYHAGVAAQDPVTHCPHAGRTGGGLCGGYCENFCDLHEAVCEPETPAYDNRADCEQECSLMPISPVRGRLDEQKVGNSVQCRIFQGGLAATRPNETAALCQNMTPSQGPCAALPCDRCYAEGCSGTDQSVECLRRECAGVPECAECLPALRDCGDECADVLLECMSGPFLLELSIN